MTIWVIPERSFWRARTAAIGVEAGMTLARLRIVLPGSRPGLSLYVRLCGRQVRGPIQQWLTAQVMGDVAGFADGGLGGFGVMPTHQMPGVVEQAMGEVVGGAQFA